MSPITGDICVPFNSNNKSLFPHHLLLRRCGAAAWSLEIPEEFGVRINHQQIAARFKTSPIGFQTLVKLVKLGVLTKRLGVGA